MNSLFLQLVTIGVAIAIGLSYIKPTFAEIETMHGEIVRTQEELGRVKAVNAKLSEVHAKLTAVPQSHRIALFTYLPDTVDEIRVMKELAEIARRGEVEVTELAAVELNERAQASARRQPQTSTPQDMPTGPVSDPSLFNLSFIASYEQMKETLALMEKNNYPLKIKSMTAKPTEAGLLDVSLEIETYAYLPSGETE